MIHYIHSLLSKKQPKIDILNDSNTLTDLKSATFSFKKQPK